MAAVVDDALNWGLAMVNIFKAILEDPQGDHGSSPTRVVNHSSYASRSRHWCAAGWSIFGLDFDAMAALVEMLSTGSAILDDPEATTARGAHHLFV